METNPPAPSEGSAHSVAGISDSVSDEHQVQSQQTTRSYECSFCKKGFSNAQALGGHMNIHRKDKAKLKQAAKTAQKPPDSSRLVDGLTASRIFKGKPLEFTSRQIGKNMNIAKWGGIFPPDHHQEVSSFPGSRNFSQMAEKIQLPIANRTEYSKPHVTANWQDIEMLHSTHGGGELDLELRLGYSPSPPPESSVTTGTIKFF